MGAMWHVSGTFAVHRTHLRALDGLSPIKSLQMRRLSRSVRRILALLYPFPGMITIADRNVLIRQRFEEGESLTDIAIDFNLSPQRVWQIVRGKDKT